MGLSGRIRRLSWISRSKELSLLLMISKFSRNASWPDWEIWSPMAEGLLFIFWPALLIPKCSLQWTTRLRDLNRSAWHKAVAYDFCQFHYGQQPFKCLLFFFDSPGIVPLLPIQWFLLHFQITGFLLLWYHLIMPC